MGYRNHGISCSLEHTGVANHIADNLHDQRVSATAPCISTQTTTQWMIREARYD